MSIRTSLTRWLAPALLGLGSLSTLPAQAGDVSLSIGFSQPGVYGRVDIGRYPPPVLVAPQPVYAGRHVYREPVYLWVPPGHRRDWRRHCGHYGACGAPVYFVDDGWYRRHVVVHRDHDRGGHRHRWDSPRHDDRRGDGHHHRHHDHPHHRGDRGDRGDRGHRD